jgi:ribosomal protein S12 methylthiotransferase accessory factor
MVRTKLNSDAAFDSLARVSSNIVDDRVGIVREVVETPRDPGAPDFFHFYAQACDTTAFTAQKNFGTGGGASSGRSRAVAKAIGEAVERYCSAIYEAERLPLFSYADAPRRCVDPTVFALHNSEQYLSPGFAFVPFERSTPVRWVEGIDPLTRESVYVPAAMVYLPYTYHVGVGEAPICVPISTGLACHMSFAQAAVSAICEVIERDAITLTWQAMMSPPQILVESLSEENYDLVRRFERTNGKVTMFDITIDAGVPSVLSVLRYQSKERPALVVAGSTSPDREDAVRKSLEELAHTNRYSQQIKTLMPRLTVDDPNHENVTDQISHLNFWCDHANLHRADFIFTSKERKEFEEIANISSGDASGDLAAIVEAVKATGHQVVLVDLTTPDVAELGFFVVRAVIPGYHPLALGFQYRSRGGKRLYEIPQKYGQKGVTREAGENPSPHPYP